MKYPLDNISRKIITRIDTWISMIESSKKKFQDEVNELNSQMIVEFNNIYQKTLLVLKFFFFNSTKKFLFLFKFREDSKTLKNLRVSEQKASDAMEEWTKIKDEIVKRINNCRMEQSEIMDNSLRMMVNFIEIFRKKLKKAENCVGTFKNNLKWNQLRTRGHYKRLHEDYNEKVKTGISSVENKYLKLVTYSCEPLKVCKKIVSKVVFDLSDPKFNR